MRLLEKVQELTFAQTLKKMNAEDAKLVLSCWGDHWYEHIFSRAHLVKDKTSADKSHAMLIFGQEWVQNHLWKPGGTKVQQKNAQIGAGEEEDVPDDDISPEEEIQPDTWDVPEALEEEDAINLEKVIKDKNLAKTTAQVRETVTEKAPVISYDYIDDPFDKEGDDQDLASACHKIYIKDNPIFWDDTVFKLKSKFCASIRLHPRFRENRLIPSRVYMWSEYQDAEDQLDYIMLGSKWIIMNGPGHYAPPNSKVDDDPAHDANRKGLPTHRVELAPISANPAAPLKGDRSMRIKREDDELLVLYEYQRYISCNEVMCIDIYTQLEHRKIDPFWVKIYFPLASSHYVAITEYLQGEGHNEIGEMRDVSTALHNDLCIETEITKLIETTPAPGSQFSEPIVIQAVLQTTLFVPVNLDVIFRNFVCSRLYPFVQLMRDSQSVVRRVYRDLDAENGVLNLEQWLKSSAHGLTIKIFNSTSARFLTLVLTDSGRLFWKVQQREQDMQTLPMIQRTASVVRDLINKINEESPDTALPLPRDQDFRFVFINSSQKMQAHGLIDHNQLSEFARCFFPYVACVVSPRKREGGEDEMGKWGTYLRFRRVSNYGEVAVIYRKIVHYMRNYMITENQLIPILEHQFSIVASDAAKYIAEVKASGARISPNPTVKPASSISRISPAGISIEIQGKSEESFRIRVVGSRSKEQTDDIYMFVDRMVSLYTRTCQSMSLAKCKSYQDLLKMLRHVTNISKRRQQVHDIVPFKPSRAAVWQGNYTRQCQNSGKLVRRPLHVVSSTALKKKGYHFNKRKGRWECQVRHPVNRQNVTLVALAAPHDRDSFYICDPAVHKQHLYIGVMGRSDPPLPCCFKKNQLYSDNKGIREMMERAVDSRVTKARHTPEHALYVKKMTGVTVPDRLHFLPVVFSRFLQPDGQFFVMGVGGQDIFPCLERILAKNRDNLWEDVREYVLKVQKTKIWESVFCFLAETRLRYSTASAFLKAIESKQLPPLAFLDLLLLTYTLNLFIVDVVSDKDCFMRCPTYRDSSFRCACIVVDQNREHHILVREQKALFEPSSTFATRLSSLAKFSCYDDSHIDYDFYLDQKHKIVGQVLDPLLRVLYFIDDQKIALPALIGRCKPTVPIVANDATQLASVEVMLASYKSKPWISVQNVIIVNKEVQGLTVEVGGAFQRREVIIPLRGRSVPKDIPQHNEWDGCNEDDETRNLVVKMEKFKEELFSIFKMIVVQSLTEDDVRDKSAADIFQLIKQSLSSVVTKSSQRADEMFKSKKQSLVDLRLGWTRDVNVCSSQHPLSKIIECSGDGGWQLPAEWFEEFLTRVSLSLQNPAMVRDFFSPDRFRVPNSSDRVARMTERENSELTIRGAQVNVPQIVSILFGSEVASATRRTFHAEVQEYDLKDEGRFFQQRVTEENDMLLRGLVNGLFYQIYRKRYGSLEVSHLGASNTLQTQLVNVVRGKITSELIDQENLVPPPLTGFRGKITPQTVLSFQRDRLPDERWLFTVWAFHRVFVDMPITILTPSNAIRFILHNGHIYEKATISKKEGIVLRIHPGTGIPSAVDCLYYKD